MLAEHRRAAVSGSRGWALLHFIRRMEYRSLGKSPFVLTGHQPQRMEFLTTKMSSSLSVCHEASVAP
jgi:hypothetical protein